MPEVITATQLRTVLGVSSGLYNDAYLDQIITTAEEALEPFLVKDEISIIEIERENDLVTLYLSDEYDFFVGEDIVVKDVRIANFDGARTITNIIDKKTIQYVTGQSGDVVRQTIIPRASVARQGRGLDYYAGVPTVESAIIEIAVDVFNSRVAPGGISQALDFTPGPYRMGKSIYQRVAGLLSDHREVGNLIG